MVHRGEGPRNVLHVIFPDREKALRLRSASDGAQPGLNLLAAPVARLRWLDGTSLVWGKRRRAIFAQPHIRRHVFSATAQLLSLFQYKYLIEEHKLLECNNHNRTQNTQQHFQEKKISFLHKAEQLKFYLEQELGQVY